MKVNDGIEQITHTADHYLSVKWLTSGTLVSYGVLRKTGALSLISETRTIIGMFLLRLLTRFVHDTWWVINNNNKKRINKREEKKKCILVTATKMVIKGI